MSVAKGVITRRKGKWVFGRFAKTETYEEIIRYTP